MGCAVPLRASLRDLLTDLLGREVTVREGTPMQLADDRPALLSTYRFDDGRMAAATICDLELAVLAGAAIGMVPANQASTGDEELREFFREVVNVLAKLLNSPSTPHVVLRDMYEVPGQVPRDVADLALGPAVRADYEVTIDGYGNGTLVLLTG